MIALAAALLALPLQFGPEILQPRSYASPSGRWTVHVDPSSRFGDGPARLRAERDGELAWERELGVTPWSAEVTEDGAFAGWGFSEGPASWEGALHVLILSPAGELLLDEAYERTGSTHPCGQPNPRVLGGFVHPELERYVLRVVDDVDHPRDEVWWTYRLATGEKLAPAHPKRWLGRSEPLLDSLAARPVAGTPLSLVQFGRRVDLLDAELRSVWSFQLPHDFERAARDPSSVSLDELRARSAFLDQEGPFLFDLHHASSGHRVTYQVAADVTAPRAWSVREVGRAVLPR